jgi:hypothetical protein
MHGQPVQVSKSPRRRVLATVLAAAGLICSPGCGDDGAPPAQPDAGPGGSDGGVRPDASFVDPEPPHVKIVFPPPRSVTNAETITVRGTADDATSVTAVSVNGTAATSDDGFVTWKAEVTLAEGENEIQVTARDATGNETEMPLQATVVRTVEIAPKASAVTWDRVGNRAIVLDASSKRIYALDPQSMKRSLISDGATGDPLLKSPVGLAWDLENERILVSDIEAAAVIAVDPATGARTVLSGPGKGDGDTLQAPSSVVWDQRNNQALVVDGLPPDQRLVGIDELGNRAEVAALGPSLTVASSITWDEQVHRALILDGFGRVLYAVDVDDGTVVPLSSSGDGRDNPFSRPVAVTWDPVNNEAVVTDIGLDALLAVSVQSGTREILASPEIGTDTVPRSPMAVTWDYAQNRLLVVDNDLGAVLAIAADTGTATVLSDAFHGLGPSLRAPTALGWDAENNRALVSDETLQAIMAIDPANGDRTVLTSPFRGGGPNLNAPVGITWDESFNRVLVLDANPGALLAVDANGQRTLLSTTEDGNQPDLADPRGLAWDPYNSRVVVANEQELVAIEVEDGKRTIASRHGILGGGSSFTAPRAVAVWQSEPGNDVVFVADSAQNAVYYVDVDFESVTSGNRTLLSSANAGSGPSLERPIAVTWDPTREQALVVDEEMSALIGVDIATGNRTILSSPEVGKGPALTAPAAVIWDPMSTRVLVLDTNLRAVLAVDPLSGDRVILAR